MQLQKTIKDNQNIVAVMSDDDLYKQLDLYNNLHSKGIADEMLIMLLEVELLNRGLEI